MGVCLNRLKAALATAALLLLPNAAFAQHQPMAVAPFSATLAPHESIERAAYCMDFASRAPGPEVELSTGSDSTAVARFEGGEEMSLAQAVAAGRLRVRGTSSYGVTLENLTEQPVQIELRSARAFSDATGDVTLNEDIAELVTTEFDSVNQYRIWRALGQVEPVRSFLVDESGDHSIVLGLADAEQRPVLTANDLERSEVTELIAAAVDEGRPVVILAGPGVSAARLRTIMTDLSLRAPVRDLRLIGAGGSEEATNTPNPGATVRSLSVGMTSSPSSPARVVTSPFDFQTAEETIPASAEVVFMRQQPRTRLARVALVVRRTIQAVATFFSTRLSPETTVADVSHLVRSAVQHEVDQLAKLEGDRGVVWIRIGREAGRYWLVRVDLRRSAQWS